jgi:hypothetical protein
MSRSGAFVAGQLDADGHTVYDADHAAAVIATSITQLAGSRRGQSGDYPLTSTAGASGDV